MTPKKLDDNICELELLNISSPTYECIHSLGVKQGLNTPNRQKIETATRILDQLSRNNPPVESRAAGEQALTLILLK
jgi:hypothetical protein